MLKHVIWRKHAFIGVLFDVDDALYDWIYVCRGITLLVAFSTIVFSYTFLSSKP